jgi:hypothetical protein
MSTNIRPMTQDERNASKQRQQANGVEMEFTRMEKRMYQLELEVTRLQKLVDIICTDYSIQHTIAVEKMKAERKEVPINESVKYELSEFAKANYGRGYTD